MEVSLARLVGSEVAARGGIVAGVCVSDSACVVDGSVVIACSAVVYGVYVCRW